VTVGGPGVIRGGPGVTCGGRGVIEGGPGGDGGRGGTDGVTVGGRGGEGEIVGGFVGGAGGGFGPPNEGDGGGCGGPGDGGPIGEGGPIGDGGPPGVDVPVLVSWNGSRSRSEDCGRTTPNELPARGCRIVTSFGRLGGLSRERATVPPSCCAGYTLILLASLRRRRLRSPQSQ